MRLTKLRIVGFKTFVEPTDIPIEPGMTGVVGPNGCGKSNLVEALRWVMGESSHKNMRASGMDEVIFGGSSSRPARNTAEVLLAIDNTDRQAPSGFNDSDALEVSRRIERTHGSSYHVNGREVRARDVQLLFADAATGARSPALVRQGQISELIAAKPEARRRILEDAAGIAGLHARRHEAELRMKHAEDNLVRVEDVLQEIAAQVDGLRRQGRQAARYRGLSAEIRKLEARLAAASWRAAEAERVAAEAVEREHVRAMTERATAQAEAARAQAVAAHEIGPLREAEAVAAAGLRRLAQARTELEAEERRATERLAELERRLAELGRDALRHAQVVQDAGETIARLDGERVGLVEASEAAGASRGAREAELATADAALAETEEALARVGAEAADLAARRGGLARELAAERERAARAERERESLDRERATREASLGASPSGRLRATFGSAEAAAKAAEDEALAARTGLAQAREAESRERAGAAEADRASQRLETELRTLARLFVSGESGRHRTVLDLMQVAPGLEAAVAAALGDDLDASTDPSAKFRWLETGAGDDDPPLPAGATPLVESVEGPPALRRRLRQIGLVEPGLAAALLPKLRPGQRLVTRAGELWRWDGLAAAADAPSAAARRLEAKNRLAELERAATGARATAEAARTRAAEAEGVAKQAAGRESAALDAVRAARRALDTARDGLARAEREETEGAARLAGLSEALERAAAAERDARGRAADTERLFDDLPDGTDVELRRHAARAAAAERREAAADARAALGILVRELDAMAGRRAAIEGDIRLWTDRSERAEAAAAETAERTAAAEAERTRLREAPDAFAGRRRGLDASIRDAERGRSEAADRLAGAETALGTADRAARESLEALAAAREARAASEARAEALARRVAELTRAIQDTFETDPEGLMALADVAGAGPLDPAAVEARLASLKGDRERLGGVNLRAEDELAEAEQKHDGLAAERDDLTEAIKRLRQAVGNLNREGRERLNAAFGIVDGHFRRLFTTLFGGGEAELSLIDSDDPLEAGLEIIARPPGKRPQSLSLLSGGEQALTATALIFAVFLTNPSPICVLDEVDAPLDDSNVERFCDLLQSMSADTDTRFLVITHNPITMARMDRLFGVTMAERGVSQLVSVDLEAAERLREAS